MKSSLDAEKGLALGLLYKEGTALVATFLFTRQGIGVRVSWQLASIMLEAFLSFQEYDVKRHPHTMDSVGFACCFLMQGQHGLVVLV